MIARAKAAIARHWPVLRLRTILFSTLLLVAALPGKRGRAVANRATGAARRHRTARSL
jgi:hypothetical protein